MEKIKTLTGILLIIILLGCQGGANPDLAGRFIEIDFPLNERSIYASALVRQHETSLELLYVIMFSLEFIKKEMVDGKQEYLAEISEYPAADLGEVVGSLTVTIDDKWVLYQNSDINNAYNMFLKTGSDTTELPTGSRSQFPAYPCKIVPNSEYSVYRPPNAGPDWEYLDVYRQFSVTSYASWATPYNTYTGLQIGGDHGIFDWELEFNMLVDSRGIVISQLSFGEIVIVDEHGTELSRARDYLINERLVDFTDPENLQTLSAYRNQYLEQGPYLYKEF